MNVLIDMTYKIPEWDPSSEEYSIQDAIQFDFHCNFLECIPAAREQVWVINKFSTHDGAAVPTFSEMLE